MGHYILPVVILRIEKISVPTLWKYVYFEKKSLSPFFS